MEFAGDSLSPLLYFYLQFMGSMLTFPFMLFNGGNVYMQGLMITAVVCAIVILYEIVKDFDNPLIGFWNVDTLTLENFVKQEASRENSNIF